MELPVAETTGASRLPDASLESVHKHKKDNLWIGTADLLSDRRVRVSFHTPACIHDARIVELIEVQRQAGIHVVHSLLRVPRGRHFVLSSISLNRSLTWTGAAQASPGGAIEVVVEASRPNSSGMPRAVLNFDFVAPGGVVTGRAEVRFVSEQVYDRMRSLPSDHVDDVSVEAVASETRAGEVEIDWFDPLLNDHPSDHLSAVAIIASVERDLVRLHGGRVDTFDAHFHSFVELDRALSYDVTVELGGSFAGIVHQSGILRVNFSGTLNPTGEITLP